jgi:hypothetical protein
MDFRILLKNTKEYKKDPSKLILKTLDKEYGYLKKILKEENNKIFITIIKSSFTKEEIEVLANQECVFCYFTAINHSNLLDKRKSHNAYTIYYDEDDFFDNLYKAVYYNPNDFLESYIKIAKQSDGYYAYTFADGFSQLINKNQIFFIQTIKKMDFVDNLCSFFEETGFELTKKTKQIYKDNFDNNDSVIDKIFECEKQYSIHTNEKGVDLIKTNYKRTYKEVIKEIKQKERIKLKSGNRVLNKNQRD